VRLNVKGVPSGEQALEYELTYRANTDHTIISFVSGIGITSYVAGHHGTVSEVNVKLTEYRAGR
jgi:hypothetical protein